MWSYFELKNRLIKWGLQGSSDWEKTFTKYTKFSKGAGSTLGYYSATVYSISAYQDFQSGNDMNGIGNIINAGMSIYMTKGGALGVSIRPTPSCPKNSKPLVLWHEKYSKTKAGYYVFGY